MGSNPGYLIIFFPTLLCSPYSAVANGNKFLHLNSLKPKVPVTEAPPRFSCNPNQFACHENGSCIPKKWVCDDEPDCEDESGKLLTYYALLSMKKSIHNSYNNFVPFQMN